MPTSAMSACLWPGRMPGPEVSRPIVNAARSTPLSSRQPRRLRRGPPLSVNVARWLAVAFGVPDARATGAAVMAVVVVGAVVTVVAVVTQSSLSRSLASLPLSSLSSLSSSSRRLAVVDEVVDGWVVEVVEGTEVDVVEPATHS